MEEMSRKKLSELVIITMMMMIMKMGINECCIESERNALLEIKSFFNSSLLPSWGNVSDDCCNWDRVTCDATTGHITELRPSSIIDVDSQEIWYLNASLFLSFQQLNLLSLQGNNIVGCIQNQGFERLSTLANLETLDLSYNKFNNTILRSLSSLQALKSLDLDSNNLKGTIDISELINLSSALEELNFNGNEIEGFETIEGFERISALANLQTLLLGRNKFNNTTLGSLNCLRSLKSLHLDGNYLKGTIDISVLSNLTSTLEDLDFSWNEIEGLKSIEGFDMLEELYLGYNKFNATTTIDFFQSIERITSLKILWLKKFGVGGSILANTQGLCNLKLLENLDISDSDLNGNLPKCLGNMTSLQRLDISNNHLQIPISLFPFFNLSKFTFLYANNNTICEDTENHNLIPKFQLQELYMDGYSDGAEIPKFLYHQHNLEYVVISSMQLRGEFPYWLLQNNTRLNTLKLSNNSFSGPIQLPYHCHANLTTLDISDNFFNNSIPSKFGISFPNLESLAMSGNELKGSIPNSLCNMSALNILDLSNNNISRILPSNISLSNLMNINLSKNKLQGSLKDTFYSSKNLYQLDLSHNSFSGTIPSWIGELSELGFLVLRDNNLQGKIPIELCNLKKLSYLDLSHNNIFGHMISCLHLTSSDANRKVYIRDIEMTMKGRTDKYQSKVLMYVSGIDISGNNMTGNIPSEIGNFTGIQVLNFSQNSFTGEIPATFSNLKAIESLDLSLNHLQGEIPPQLTQLTYLAAFNVSYNNLSGPIPNAVNQFGTFNESSYKGNPFLCGLSLSKSCSSADSPPPNARIIPNSDGSRNRFIDMEDFFVSFGISYGTMLLTLTAILCINPYWRRVWFYHVQLTFDKTYYFIIDNVIPLFSKF